MLEIQIVFSLLKQSSEEGTIDSLASKEVPFSKNAKTGFKSCFPALSEKNNWRKSLGLNFVEQ